MSTPRRKRKPHTAPRNGGPAPASVSPVNGNGDHPLPSPAPVTHAALSDLISRIEFARLHNLPGATTYGGLRNMDAELGYAPKLTIAQYRARYERGGIAERIVEGFPLMTWGDGLDIVETEDPEEVTKFEAQVREHLVDRLDVIGKLTRADILARLGEYSVVWVGVGIPGDDPATELPRLRGPEQIIFLTPVAQDRATIYKKVKEKWDQRFDLPEIYEITISDNSTVRVHWTRIVHIAEGLLESDTHGKPALRAVWNYLDDLQKIVGGGAEAAWKRMDPGAQFDLDPDMVLDAAEELKLSNEIDEYVHGLRRVMKTRGVKANLLSTSVSAFGANAQTVLDLACATTGYPQRWLMGSERGELASSQDRHNLDDRVTQRQAKFATPILRRVIDMLIERGALVRPREYSVVWPEEEELSTAEKAELALAMAKAKVHTKNEIRDIVWGLEPRPEFEDEVTDPNDPDDDPDDPDDPDADDDSEPASRGAAALADTPADEPEWRAVHRAADAHRDSLALAIRGAWRDAATGIDDGEFVGAVEVGDMARAEGLALAAVNSAHATLEGLLPDRLRAVVADAGLAVLRSVRARGSWYVRRAGDRSSSALSPVLRGSSGPDVSGSVAPLPQPTIPSAIARDSRLPEPGGDRRTSPLPGLGRTNATTGSQAYLPVPWGNGTTNQGACQASHMRRAGELFSTSFEIANPRAVSFAALRSSALITEVAPDTIAAVRTLITEGISAGLAPRKLAQRVRETVGLRTDQLRAVENLRARLAAAKPGDIVRAGKTKIRVPKSGGNSAAWIDKHASAYADRLLNQRALLISRTETLRSANAGQRELWKQAQDAGDLPADLKRVWIATPDARVRDEHAEMDGQVVGVDEPFSPVSEPGSEPNCRCAQGLTET